MAKTIYQLFMMRPSEAWYQLSKEEQDNLLAKQEESSKKAGAKSLVFADSAWSNEEWMYFGVNEYPDLESLQEHEKELGDNQWFRYIESKVILGTEWVGNRMGAKLAPIFIERVFSKWAKRKTWQ